MNHLIVLQNVFCINRAHWTKQRLYTISSNIIFATTLITLIVVNIFVITDLTQAHLPHSSVLFAYSFKYILLIELIPLTVLAKRDKLIKKLNILEEKCEDALKLTRNQRDESNENEKSVIILSILSVLVDAFGYIFLEYPSSVIATLPLAFAAHDSEILLYSRIVNLFNSKLTSLAEVNVDVGSKVYRHIVIAASHFSENYRFTMSFMVLMTLITTVYYIGVSVVIEGPRTHKVLSYLVYRELRSLFSLWILCSAAHRTRILYKCFVKRLTERFVFEMNTCDKSSRKQMKRWLRCAKRMQVSYLPHSSFALDLALPLGLLDYSTNYLLIIVQGYPLVMQNVPLVVME